MMRTRLTIPFQTFVYLSSILLHLATLTVGAPVSSPVTKGSTTASYAMTRVLDIVIDPSTISNSASPASEGHILPGIVGAIIVCLG
ncbi:hypothetical protein OF83DRAFT_1160202, partial [Amylostereum chailletii]